MGLFDRAQESMKHKIRVALDEAQQAKPAVQQAVQSVVGVLDMVVEEARVTTCAVRPSRREPAPEGWGDFGHAPIALPHRFSGFQDDTSAGILSEPRGRERLIVCIRPYGQLDVAHIPYDGSLEKDAVVIVLGRVDGLNWVKADRMTLAGDMQLMLAAILVPSNIIGLELPTLDCPIFKRGFELLTDEMHCLVRDLAYAAAYPERI